jgi:hypothetical protein
MIRAFQRLGDQIVKKFDYIEEVVFRIGIQLFVDGPQVWLPEVAQKIYIWLLADGAGNPIQVNAAKPKRFVEILLLLELAENSSEENLQSVLGERILRFPG